MSPLARLRRLLVRAVAVAVLAAGPGLAQEAPVPLLTLDQERLFVESAFGRAAIEREQAATAALAAENSRIESELIAEEQELTDRRPTLPAEEFAALATEFDERVERIRAERDEKAREVLRARDEDRRAFFRAVGPVLAALMDDKGAVAIIDKGALVLSLSVIDITDEAIARVDAALGSGPGAPPAPAPADGGAP